MTPPDPLAIAREALERIAKIADEPRKDWSRVVGDTAKAALAQLAAKPVALPQSEEIQKWITNALS